MKWKKLEIDILESESRKNDNNIYQFIGMCLIDLSSLIFNNITNEENIICLVSKGSDQSITKINNNGKLKIKIKINNLFNANLIKNGFFDNYHSFGAQSSYLNQRHYEELRNKRNQSPHLGNFINHHNITSRHCCGLNSDILNQESKHYKIDKRNYFNISARSNGKYSDNFALTSRPNRYGDSIHFHRHPSISKNYAYKFNSEPYEDLLRQASKIISNSKKTKCHKFHNLSGIQKLDKPAYKQRNNFSSHDDSSIMTS